MTRVVIELDLSWPIKTELKEMSIKLFKKRDSNDLLKRICYRAISKAITIYKGKKEGSKEILDHKANLKDLKNTLLNETIPHIENELQDLEGAGVVNDK